MNKLSKCLALVLLPFAATLFGLLLLTNSVRYKPYGVPDQLRSKWDALQLQIAVTEAAKNRAYVMATGASQTLPQVLTPRPVAATDETEFAFGLMAPGVSASHIFTIRNEGDLPLVVTPGDTSCKCTVSRTSREVVEPGGEAQVTLTWNSGRSREFYRQYAVIKTNDPERREIELGITGQIKSYLAFNVEEVVAETVQSGDSASASFILYSQALAQFEIDSVECELPGFAYVDRLVQASELKALGATSARRIDVVTGQLPSSGDLRRALRVRVRPIPRKTGDSTANLGGSTEDEEVLHRDVPFFVRVAAPISFYGSELRTDEGLHLGAITQGSEKIARVIVRIRSDDPPAHILVTRVEPEFLQVTVDPHRQKPGTYTLTIRVPADAPQTIFNLESQHGEIQVGDPLNPLLASGFPVFGTVLSR